MSKTKTLSEVNCNPLNIRFSPENQWQGQTGVNRGFCVFKSEAYGFRAAYRLLTNYIKHGFNTIEKIITRWAPPSENDTDFYIKFVCQETIIDRDQILTDVSIHDYWTKLIILRAMAKMECGKWYDEQQINLFINYPERY